MLRQGISSQQRNLFVCAFCRTTCGRLGQRPPRPSNQPRWHSSASQSQAQNGHTRNVFVRTSSTIGHTLSQNTTAAGAGSSTKAPAPKEDDDGDDDDFLLPHELAARARSAKPTPPPPPQPTSQPPPPQQLQSQQRSLPQRAQLEYKDNRPKRSLVEDDDNDFLTPEQVAARGRAYNAPNIIRQFSSTGSAATLGPNNTAGNKGKNGPLISYLVPVGQEPFPVPKSDVRELDLGKEGARPSWGQLPRRSFTEFTSTPSKGDQAKSRDNISDFSRNVWAPSLTITRTPNGKKPGPYGSARNGTARRTPGRDGQGDGFDFPRSSLGGHDSSHLGRAAAQRTDRRDNDMDFFSKLGGSVDLKLPPKKQTRPSNDNSDDFMAKFEGFADTAPPSNRSAKKKAAPATDGDWNWVGEVERKAEINSHKAELQKQQDASSAMGNGGSGGAMYGHNDQQYDVVEDRWSKGRDRGVRDRPQAKPKPRFSKHNRRDDEDDYDENVEAMAEARRQRKEQRRLQREQEEREREEAGAVKNILIPQFITVADLGQSLGHKPAVFLKQLVNMGFEEITVESVMAGETAALVAQEYGFEPILDVGDQVDLKPRPQPEDPSVLPPRPPIVTIMGHVDHGKTTMLDWLRKSSIVSGEHGGITQHIGAFSVKMSTGKVITFLDTPGHAAFLTMRQRGANITDMVILVVAADDSVKPQTIEALKHARAAKVPIIVAINKVDKEEARVDHVKLDLSKNGVELEDFGGDVQAVCVSGKTGLGMADLEENIIALAEVLDMRAETDGMAEGWVLESAVKPLGRAASVLVKRGTLRKGDLIAAGTSFAKVRLMLNEAGQEVDEAPPGTPVEVFGWRGTPAAGDMVIQAPDEDRVREAIRYREELEAWQKTADDVAAQEKAEREKVEREKLEAEMKELMTDQGEEAAGEGDEGAPGTTIVNFLIRGDVMGSVEAVQGSVMEIGNNEVRPRILQSGPGQVNESDVEHAATTGSIIINFNSPILPNMERLASQKGVRILDHSIIYHLVDDVKAVMSEKLPPSISYKVNGEAEVLQVFPINTKGRKYMNIAGCRVRNGNITKNSVYRVIRGTKEVFDGKLESLKNVKKDITEAKKNAECGIQFDGWDDMKVGDKIQAYEVIKERRVLS